MMWHRRDVARVGSGQDGEERLGILLGVEGRLQGLVRAAADAAAGRVAAAAAGREAALAAARRTAERASEEEARREDADDQAALAAIEHASHAAVAAIRDLDAARVDALARWALQDAIDGTGEPP
jgi:hypothetical protein